MFVSTTSLVSTTSFVSTALSVSTIILFSLLKSFSFSLSISSISSSAFSKRSGFVMYSLYPKTLAVLFSYNAGNSLSSLMRNVLSAAFAMLSGVATSRLTSSISEMCALSVFSISLSKAVLAAFSVGWKRRQNTPCFACLRESALYSAKSLPIFSALLSLFSSPAIKG